ncbi:MAG: FtsW/RodA/SpoVE family cell cycle protein, partial [Chloroflexi bacterium]|nr:FtsW/RodA/SpoVE family cell cycle protein [Chloroflexota bacterium]
LLGIVALLTGLGLAMVTRLAPSLAARQTVWILVGIATMVAVLVFPRPVIWLKRYKYTWAMLGLLLVMATVAIGKDPNQSGARLWLGFGGVLFQPSELLKVLLAIFLAAYMDDKRELLSGAVYRVGPLRLPPLPYLGPLVVIWGVSVLVLFGQRDLGPAFLIFGVFLAMLYVASSRAIYVWGGLAMFGAAFILAVQLIKHAAVRVSIWLNPWADPQGSAYQLVQSLVAIANGGVLGTGLGYGRPDLIPAVHTDFPFAAMAEELGMAGVLA